MSMEIYVLSDRRLPSIDHWQRAIDAEGFDLRLSAERSFEALRGHLPALWGEKRAGFECDHWDAGDVIDAYPSIDFGHRWRRALALRWGADLNACQGAYMAATAYARATDGLVLDCEGGKVLTAQQALEVTRKMEKDLPAFEQALRDVVRRFTPES